MTDPITTEPAPTSVAPPLITAHGVGVRTHRGWAVHGVDVEVREHDVIALVGDAGSGRTSALMVLASIMRPTHGRFESRASVSIARLEGVADLEARFTVAECVSERLVLSKVPARQGRANFSRACEVLEVPPGGGRTWIEDLAPAHRTSLAVALALMSEPDVVVVDDLDDGVGLAAQRVLWGRMRELSQTPVAVLATAVDGEPASEGADSIVRVVRPSEDGRAER